MFPGLLAGITAQINTHHFIIGLYKTAAIKPQNGFASPQIRRIHPLQSKMFYYPGFKYLPIYHMLSRCFPLSFVTKFSPLSSIIVAQATNLYL